jgi:DNA polymerase III delta prime subunit
MMDKREDHPHWHERYRPLHVKDVILPADIKKTFLSIAKDDMVPDLVLAGISGFGKTTVARALLSDMDIEYMFVNGSMQRNIDTLRVEIQDFASTVSFNDRRKAVIIDEADNLNKVSTQPAMRAFIDEYSRNCSFILTCNYKEQIIAPLLSRFQVVDFKVPVDAKERSKLAGEFMKRCEAILDEEGVKYDAKSLALLISTHFPNWRKVLIYLQKFYREHGEITSGILAQSKDTNITTLVRSLKVKDFPGVRKWVGECPDSPVDIYRKMYESGTEFLTDPGHATLAVLIAKYQYQQSFVADPEVNTSAFMVEVMMSCEFR